MFEEIERMSKGLYNQMMTDAKKQSAQQLMSRVNFVIEKRLKDGRILRANSYNPILLLRAFKEFLRRAEGKDE